MSSSAEELRARLHERSGNDRRERPSGRRSAEVTDLADRLSSDRRSRSRRSDLDGLRNDGPDRRERVRELDNNRDSAESFSDDGGASEHDRGTPNERAAVGARPSSTLQQAWIDPEEMPFEPVPRPGNPLTARLIAWVGVALFLAGLGWLIIPELDVRLRSLETLQLSDGVLSAQPVQLAPVRAAIVSELYVDASRLPDGVLPEGSPIALLESTSLDGTRQVANEMTVPFDARFVSVDTLVGGVVLPGTPVATIYDPTKMYVIVSVRPELLDVMRRGMTARLISEVAGVEIEGEVISAVPLLGTDHEPTTANLVNVRIKPDPEGVADLVPGIRFDALIDLSSAPPNAQPLVFTYAGHVDASGESTGADGSEIDEPAAEVESGTGGG